MLFSNTLIFCFAAILSGVLKGQRRKDLQLMELLLRVLPTPGFFLKKTALPWKLRLLRSVAKKRRLRSPAPGRLQLIKLGSGLGTLKKLLLGVHRLPFWKM
jgi:hypothetical protein